jgi:hypothetical protein
MDKAPRTLARSADEHPARELNGRTDPPSIFCCSRQLVGSAVTLAATSIVQRTFLQTAPKHLQAGLMVANEAAPMTDEPDNAEVTLTRASSKTKPSYRTMSALKTCPPLQGRPRPHEP